MAAVVEVDLLIYVRHHPIEHQDFDHINGTGLDIFRSSRTVIVAVIQSF